MQPTKPAPTAENQFIPVTTVWRPSLSFQWPISRQSLVSCFPLSFCPLVVLGQNIWYMRYRFMPSKDALPAIHQTVSGNSRHWTRHHRLTSSFQPPPEGMDVDAFIPRLQSLRELLWPVKQSPTQKFLQLHYEILLSTLNYIPTRMWADAQRKGRPAEYRWRPLRKFRNSIPCTMPQSLADAHCSSAVQ